MIPSEVSQKEKDKYYMIFHLYVESKKNRINEFICKMETHRHREQIHGYQRMKGREVNLEYEINRHNSV